MGSQNSEVRNQKTWPGLGKTVLGLILGVALGFGIFNALGAATDDFSASKVDLASPPANGFVITPHDSNELANVTRAIYVGVSGDIVVVYAGNNQQATLKSVPVGRLSGRFKRVLNTNTTATNLIGEY